MRALVTGAAGFIGAHVVRQLCEQGADVRALVLPRDDLRNLRALDVDVRLGDVTDGASVARAMRGADVVFHLAAIYALWTPDGGARMRRVNVDGTRIVLEEARRAGVRRVVHTSSIARFGGQGRGRRATEASAFALGPTGSVYAASKRDAHEVALDAARAGQDVVLVAPCGPIGPGDVGPTPTGRLLIECLRLPVVAVTPTVTNFVDVRDVARGHLLAAERGLAGETYLLGHRDLDLRALAEMALRVIGRRAPVVEIPWPAARAAGRALTLLADRVTRRAPPLTREAIAIAELGLAADASKAVRELGMPQSPIERALEDALAWFAREGYLDRSARSLRARTGARAARGRKGPERASRCHLTATRPPQVRRPLAARAR